MSRVSNAYKKIEHFRRLGCTSHAWIDLLRMIEACARSHGQRFTEVKAALELRVPLGIRPEMPAIVLAAGILLAEHEKWLAARALMVAARRNDKRNGQRAGNGQPALTLIEHQVNANPLVRVGYWGWERRRAQEGSGPGVSGPLGGNSGLAM